MKKDVVLVPATHSPWTELLCKNLKPGSDASIGDITEISTSAAGTQQNMLLLLEKYEFLGTPEDMQHHYPTSTLNNQEVEETNIVNRISY